VNKLVRHDERDALSVGYRCGLWVDEKRGFTVGNEAPVLHCPRRKIWNGNKVALADGKLKVKNLGAAVRYIRWCSRSENFEREFGRKIDDSTLEKWGTIMDAESSAYCSFALFAGVPHTRTSTSAEFFWSKVGA
jgi:hypothetical protein